MRKRQWFAIEGREAKLYRQGMTLFHADRIEDPLFSRLSLAWQFAVAGAAVLVVGMVLIGLWVTSRIEREAVRNAGSATALYVDSIIAPLTSELTSAETLSEGARKTLTETLQQGALSTRLFSFKLWRTDGTIIFASSPSLIGKRFKVSPKLASASAGTVHAEFDHLHSDENRIERESRIALLEIYSPIREAWSGEVVAVAEFYEKADELRADLNTVRMQSWLVVAAVTAGMLVLLFGIVARGNHRIKTQRRSLDAQVVELSRMLAVNRSLRLRADRANQRAAALNEQYLRRISAELHDGPTQLLGFAALRLEAISTGRARDDDALRVQQSINTAIEDIRNICRGLTLPELEMLSGDDVALRAIREHETHSRGEVLARIAPVHVASQAAKICIYRFIQETLSNAARHAKASRVSVGVAEAGGMVEICVEDDGIGFVRRPDDRGLGLTGLEERITGLGGQLEIQSGSAGTTLRMKIPAHDTDHA